MDDAGAPQRPGGLLGALEALDPVRRPGQPHSVELRQLDGLPPVQQAKLGNLLDRRMWLQAAALWKRGVSGDLQFAWQP